MWLIDPPTRDALFWSCTIVIVPESGLLLKNEMRVSYWYASLTSTSLNGRHGRGEMEERGPRARTRRLMLEAATSLMQAGLTPSVSEVA